MNGFYKLYKYSFGNYEFYKESTHAHALPWGEAGELTVEALLSLSNLPNASGEYETVWNIWAIYDDGTQGPNLRGAIKQAGGIASSTSYDTPTPFDCPTLNGSGWLNARGHMVGTCPPDGVSDWTGYGSHASPYDGSSIVVQFNSNDCAIPTADDFYYYPHITSSGNPDFPPATVDNSSAGWSFYTGGNPPTPTSTDEFGYEYEIGSNYRDPDVYNSWADNHTHAFGLTKPDIWLNTGDTVKFNMSFSTTGVGDYHRYKIFIRKSATPSDWSSDLVDSPTASGQGAYSGGPGGGILSWTPTEPGLYYYTCNYWDKEIGPGTPPWVHRGLLSQMTGKIIVNDITKRDLLQFDENGAVT